jgi:hypothetical protein
VAAKEEGERRARATSRVEWGELRWVGGPREAPDPVLPPRIPRSPPYLASANPRYFPPLSLFSSLYHCTTSCPAKKVKTCQFPYGTTPTGDATVQILPKVFLKKYLSGSQEDKKISLYHNLYARSSSHMLVQIWNTILFVKRPCRVYVMVFWLPTYYVNASLHIEDKFGS